MLGKILLTLAVILAAFFFVRQRNLAENPPKKTSPAKPPKKTEAASARDELNADLRAAAYMLLVLMVGLGGIMYYYRWQDDHTVLAVTLHRESQTEPIRYEVYKYQLFDRSFITVDGTSVTVASSERMEVLGLE